MNLTPRYNVILEEVDGEHHYRKDDSDIWYPGATTILQAYPKQLYLVPWACKLSAEYLRPYILGPKQATIADIESILREAKLQHKIIKEEAGRLGTIFHQTAELLVAGKKVEMLIPELQIAWESFHKWLDERKPKFLMGDTKVLNDAYGYAGSFDALIEEDGELTIIDFKTSKSIHDEFALQVASYAAAFCTTYGIDSMPSGRIVRFRKDRVCYEERDIVSTTESFKDFLHVKATYDAMKKECYVKKEKIKKEKMENVARTTGDGKGIDLGLDPSVDYGSRV
jgi:hypothetical protein